MSIYLATYICHFTTRACDAWGEHYACVTVFKASIETIYLWSNSPPSVTLLYWLCPGKLCEMKQLEVTFKVKPWNAGPLDIPESNLSNTAPFDDLAHSLCSYKCIFNWSSMVLGLFLPLLFSKSKWKCDAKQQMERSKISENAAWNVHIIKRCITFILTNFTRIWDKYIAEITVKVSLSQQVYAHPTQYMLKLNGCNSFFG